MEFGILGPLAAWNKGRELPLGGAKQRALLAILLLRANEVVATARLVDELWEERPPATAVKAVQVYVSQLRKVLGDGVVETQPAGYRLRLDPGALDLARFEALFERGRELLAGGEPGEAGEVLRAALGLWRGPPLAGLEFEAFAASEISRLEEMRLATVESRLEADLALGRHAGMVGELEGLVLDHPLRESLRGLLMVALYRAGRQADALSVYREGRAALVDELGLDPSEALQQLEVQILRHDAALDLPPAPPAAEPRTPERTRKIVTVLFCDIVADERLDPEALQGLLSRSFELTRVAARRHGGTAEALVGGEVMAVFGIPLVHEDDALRAVRAAIEIRDALAEIGAQSRIGVSSGEVITDRLAVGLGSVTGSAVAAAKALERDAAVREVVIGELTRALVGDGAEVEPVELSAATNGAPPAASYRVLAVNEAPQRAHGMQFVGRRSELELIADAWRRVQDGQRCERVTIVGDAGVGKSRLTAKALASLEVPVVRGRCLSYGAGITYWPVLEIVRQLGALPSDPAAATAIRSLLGESDAGTSADEIAWSFRKLLEEQAPLVVVFDDIQWGEETLLDLIEHVALLSSAAPLLLLCLARPELLETRPSWPVSTRLQPLTSAEAAILIGTTVTKELGAKIAHSAAGNPLFIGEMLAMASENGSETVVPATLTALLAARLDRLDPGERRVLERGSVEGEIFHRGAVQALIPEEPQLESRLTALVRRELIRPYVAQLEGEDAFRFRHLLLRDAAYGALPKSSRAELHERHARWLDEQGDELDEFLGYHLEQAARYKLELGHPDPALAEGASERLAAAGRRALWRGDVRAAEGLLERALELTRPIRVDVMLELDLGSALSALDGVQAASAIADAAAERARAAGDRKGELLARVGAADYRLQFDVDPAVDELDALAREALPLLEQAQDHAGLAHVWRLLGYSVANFRGRYDDWAHAAERALRHTRLAGQRHSSLLGLDEALVYGPRPADEALLTLDRLLPENPHPFALLCRAWLLAMLSRFDEAARAAQEGSDRFRDLTGGRDLGHVFLGPIAATSGDHELAALHFRRYCDLLEERNQRGHLSTYAPLLGGSLCALGLYDEAEALAQLGRELGDEWDTRTQARWRQVQALVDASRGHYARAEQLAREAVAITERTNGLNEQASALCDLAEVLHGAGRVDEAEASLARALERYERKLNLAEAAQTRERMAQLGG